MLEGKAAVVTNSGRGMGRAIALSMAADGARVVVQDWRSGGREGAEEFVSTVETAEKIREGGGEAIAYSESVTSWDGSQDLIQTALGHFGRLDIVVNSPKADAGLRAPMISEIEQEEWESVQRDTLKTSFCVTRAALPSMRKQKQGRLIHFTSPGAVIGGVGYAHHGAVEMAVAGLSRNAAIEMERYRVTSNCIVPCSGPGSVWDPVDVAPLAVFLASDAAQGLSGQMFGVWGKEIFLFSQPRIQRSIHNSQGWTVERLSAVFESTMQRHFTPLESSDSYFCWDSIL